MNQDIIGLTGSDRMLMEEQQANMIAQNNENPFNAPQYQQHSTPDVPMNYGGSMVDVLINDSEIPDIIKKKWWNVFNRDNILTFLDNERKNQKMMAFDTTVIDSMNSMESYYDYTFETEMQYGVVRNVFDTKLDRSVGIKGGNIKNERVILQSQFTENRHVNEDGNMGSVKEGFFKRLLGRR